MANPMVPLVKYLLLERPARKRDIASLVESLERGASRLEAHFATVPDTAANREQLRHVIGMERWGQRRLRVALGEPPVSDEMDGYMPLSNSSLDTLRVAFGAARGETLVLARQLEARKIDGDLRVPHNQFGPLSVRGWLLYLHTHSAMEGKRAK